MDSSPRSLTKIKTSLQPENIHPGTVDRVSGISENMLGLLHILIML